MNKKYPPFLASEFPNGTDASLFHILPVPLERSVSFGGGTRFGPSEILKASSQLEIFDGFSIPGEEGLKTLPPIKCKGKISSIVDSIADSAEAILAKDKIPVLLGGEHTVSYGAFIALDRLKKNIGIVQIDAHADLRDSYEGSKFSHASVMKRAFDLGFPIYQLGVRSLSPQEIELRKDSNIMFCDAVNLCTPETLNEIELPDDFPNEIYLTIDVDGFDPSIFPGTGTPEPGGLGWYQVLNIINSITSKHKIIGFDVVEVSPLKENNISEFTAARLIYNVMGSISRSRKLHNIE